MQFLESDKGGGSMRQREVNTILILNKCLTSFSSIVWSISVRKTDRIHNKNLINFGGG